MDLQLGDKTAFITGSSKGIGEAIAMALAREGAHVVVHGRDDVEAQRVVSAILAVGGRAHAVLGDLTQDEAVERLIAEAEDRVGAISILVNNAGGSGPKSDWETTAAAGWASTYDRNVLAAVRVSTRLLPGMRQAGWGRVINISSGAATMPPATGPDYSAAKAAMNALTASMAKAVAAEGITVNAISPGTIKSAKLENGFRTVAAARGIASEDAPWEEIQRGVLKLFAHVPVGRVGELAELADAAAFLASPLAGYVTGINLHVDGGFLSIP
ncbi:SDR family NAD(P)-dependent oxidoreductase [Lichenihabitans sp. PAMC28606]|uniref:SDR family NAD(P)-dependent oxidoreductase n=1 Tax=Lichenihabitans sp. PAMC28606 TaxID=2880932 RepID=UPI001D0A342E|nr:SDR family NAD(P)-dependent oxidoreductase [Lichenihabitans sp. PAMC28606]UDL94421.1 SDR family NAD(P)-dependent oxidoreductase [Lichenihabitans sp. PAMC28606]